jgi:hypothetical protein
VLYFAPSEGCIDYPLKTSPDLAEYGQNQLGTYDFDKACLPTSLRCIGLSQNSNVLYSIVYRYARRWPFNTVVATQALPHRPSQYFTAATKSLGRLQYPITITHQFAFSLYFDRIGTEYYQENATQLRHARILTWQARSHPKAIGGRPILNPLNPRIGDEAWHLDPRRPSLLANNMSTSPWANTLSSRRAERQIPRDASVFRFMPQGKAS